MQMFASFRTYLTISGLFLTLGFTGCSWFAGSVDENILTGNIHWEGEVRIQGKVVIEKGATLTIAPGTRVLFMPYTEENPDQKRGPHELRGSKLLVHGQLVARGTAYEPIVFSYYDSNAPAGSWGGIKIQDAEEVYFYNCEFRQAMNAIHSCRSWVSIEYSKFENNKVGILFHNARLFIERNLFRNNGTAFYYLSGSPVIAENKIANNDNGLVIADVSEDYLIEKNSFLENRSYNVGLGERVRRSVNLRNNYWGKKAGDASELRLFDGRSSLWKGEINYLPMRTEPITISGLE